VAEAAPRGVGWRLRDVLSPGFQGSRADLDVAVGRRLEVALVLVFLAARVVHLGQAGVDLALAQDAYTRPWLADLTGAACLVESGVLATAVLRRGRLTLPAMLADGAFGLAGLVALSAATTAAPGRVAALNWMLQYTVATATGLGLVAQGRLLPPGDGRAGGRPRPWAPAAATVVLAATYAASTLLPQVVPGEDRASVAQDTANYVVFFLAAVLASAALRRVLAALARRNAEVAAAASAVAHAAQWRAVAVDVFGPVLQLLDDVAASEGPPRPGVQEEAGRLIELIESVRPAGG
jgi:hypothetical protein